MSRFWLVLTFWAISLWIAQAAKAQDAPKFWTKQQVVMTFADAAAKAADYHYTMKCSDGAHFQEYNPIARPWVTHGRPLAGVYFAGAVVMDTFFSYQLQKRGHPKMARAVMLIGIIGNAQGAAFTSRN